MTSQNSTHATPAPVLLTRREAAHRYSISLRQVDNLLRADVMPQVRIGRSVRVPVDQADAAIMSFAVGRATSSKAKPTGRKR